MLHTAIPGGIHGIFMFYSYAFMTVFTPHSHTLNHVNLNGSNYNPLVLIIGIKLKSM